RHTRSYGDWSSDVCSSDLPWQVTFFGLMNTGINAINEAVQEASAFLRPLFNELGKVIVGQTYLVERLVIGLLANGHVLLEGVPGLAKTLAVKSLAGCISVKFSRLQFTPDMLPADVI